MQHWVWSSVLLCGLEIPGASWWNLDGVSSVCHSSWAKLPPAFTGIHRLQNQRTLVCTIVALLRPSTKKIPPDRTWGPHIFITSLRTVIKFHLRPAFREFMAHVYLRLESHLVQLLLIYLRACCKFILLSPIVVEIFHSYLLEFLGLKSC